MKAKLYVHGKKPVIVMDLEVGKKRMEAYLKATQPAFEAAVAHANTHAVSHTGVLAGPRVRT